MGLNRNLINKVTASQIRDDLSNFKVGDAVKVHAKIKEGEKERIQMFEGVVIRIRGEGISRTFTVRKMTAGTAIERIFVLNSPLIAAVDIIKTGNVRQSRIYFMRERSGKSARIKPRQAKNVKDQERSKKAEVEEAKRLAAPVVKKEYPKKVKKVAAAKKPAAKKPATKK
jgi:large subunit ribosomal protein L19